MAKTRKQLDIGIRLRPSDDALVNEGDISVSKTTPKLKAKVDSADRNIVTEDQTQTLTNKTIDSASNTITIDADEATVSELETDNFKTAALTSDLNASAAATQLVTADEVKDYVDTQIAGKDEADEISFDDTNPNVTGANLQLAVDDVANSAAAASTAASTAQTTADDHIADAIGAHTASAITNVPSGSLAATDVQAALNEVQTDADSGIANAATAQSTADNHISDAVGAHAASAIANTPVGNLAATDIQGAVDELQTDIDTRALDSDLTNHISDAIDAHDASAISNIPAGNLAATDIQGAVDELQTDIDTRALDSALTSHTGATAAHGATGAVVGTTNTQTLTNKTLTSPSITTPTRLDVKQDTLTNLTVYAATASNGQLCFATNTKQMFQVVDSALAVVGGGSGGLDVFHTQDFEILTAVNDSGKNAAFLGGGVLDGAFAIESSTPIAGAKSGKYTAGSASTNDYIEIETIDLDLKQRDTDIKVRLSADMSGFSSDVTFVIYDKTNSSVLSSSNHILVASEGRTFYEFPVKTLSTTAQISYGFHMIAAPTNTELFTFDDVEFSTNPFVTKELTTITEWEDFTPTGTWTTNASYKGKKRRVGDSMELSILVSTSGAPTGTFTVNIPDGLTIDTSKLNNSVVFLHNNFGYGFIRDNSSSAARTGGAVNYNTSTSLRMISEESATVDAITPFTFAINDDIAFNATVPIAEWQAKSDEIITPSSVAKQYDRSGGGEITGTNSWSTTTASLLPYKTGDGAWRLKFNISGTITSNTSCDLTIVGATFKTGSNQAVTYYDGQLGPEGSQAVGGGSIIQLRASGTSVTAMRCSGDVELDSRPTWADDVSANFLAALPSQRLHIEAASNASQGVANINEKITFGTEDRDTHGAFSSSTFTVPTGMSGSYTISASLQFNASVATFADAFIYVNGSSTRYYNRESKDATSLGMTPHVTATLFLEAGDTIEIYGYIDSGSDVNVLSGASGFATFLTIVGHDLN